MGEDVRRVRPPSERVVASRDATVTCLVRRRSPLARRWVKPEASNATAQFKWVSIGAPHAACPRACAELSRLETLPRRPGADARTEEERLAKRRKYTPLKVEPIPDLASFLPPSGSGWGGEKVAAAAVAEPEAPRRSLRARTERTYVDGEDDDFEDERSMSEDEAPPRPQAAAAAAPPPPAPVLAPAPAAPAASPPPPDGPAPAGPA